MGFLLVLISRIFFTNKYVIHWIDRLKPRKFTRLQILSGEFCREFSKLESALELDGVQNPLNELYRQAEEMELAQAEKRVRERLANLL